MKLLGPPQERETSKGLKVRGRVKGYSFGAGKGKATITIQVGEHLTNDNTFEVVVPRWYADNIIGKKVTILIAPATGV